jgi:DNA-binding protein H-NS
VKIDTLNELNDSELQAVIARSDEILTARDRQRKEKAIEDARAILAGAGLSLKDIAKPQKNGAKGHVYHAGRRYEHPTNKTLIWNGKGQKPNWLRELETQGGKAVELP